MKEFVSIFKGKKVLILGFGKEGVSTYKALRSFLPELHISIADKNKKTNELFSKQFQNDNNITFTSGENYLQNIDKYDIIIKSPGISFKELNGKKCNAQITSQTELFIQLFKNRIIGITGTKGKSTTASLLLQIIKESGKDALLVGNIGIPPFDHLQKISDKTIIVYEMSSHQLENIKVSPHISVLLNIYQEHLDHYESYNAYKEAKFNIARWQTKNDYLIIDKNNEAIRNMPAEYFGKGQNILLNDSSGGSLSSYCKDDDIYFSYNSQEIIFQKACLRRKLKGEHNLINIQSAAVAAYLAGIPVENILQAISVFEGLPHRLETVETDGNILFINDSISTIPEATIAALKTFPETGTLLLGGYDRGINYEEFADFLINSTLKNIIFIGKAGKRLFDICSKLNNKNHIAFYLPETFGEAIKTAKEVTKHGEICLLSPAASSYDMFKNFEERGNKFKELITGT